MLLSASPIPLLPMPLLLNLPPVVPAVPPEHAFMVYVVPLAAFLFAMYSFFRRESAETRTKRETAAAAALVAVAARDERIKEIATKLAEHEIRFTGVVNEHTRHCDEVLVRFTAHEQRLAEIPPMREGMVEVRSQIKYMSEGFSKLEVKIDRLIDRLTKPA